MKPRRLHRILALPLALPLLWLCISGLVLNHAPELGLDQKNVSSPILLKPYLSFPKDKAQGLQIGSRQIAVWGEQLFLDQKLLDLAPPLVGAIPLGPHLLIANSKQLILLDANDQLLDQLDETSLPETPILALSSSPPLIQGSSANYHLDSELLDFPAANLTPLIPQTLSPVDENPLREALIAHTPVSQYRLWLDLHKFSFLGAFGKWVLSLSTIGLIILLLSGLGLLKKRKRSK